MILLIKYLKKLIIKRYNITNKTFNNGITLLDI